MDNGKGLGIAHAARYAVVKTVSENRCTADRIEKICVDLLTGSATDLPGPRRFSRTIEEMVEGAMSGAGSYEPVVVYGAVRGAIRGGRKIGIDPLTAAIVAIETATTAWTDDGSPVLIDAAVNAAMSAAAQIGPPLPDELQQWLDERVPFAAYCLHRTTNETQGPTPCGASRIRTIPTKESRHASHLSQQVQLL
jgi:hypothetical protein